MEARHADLISYEVEGQVLWQGNPDQGSDPDYLTALETTPGLRYHLLHAQLPLLGRRRKRLMADPRLRKNPDGPGRAD